MKAPFLRPEVGAALRRWREPLAAGAVAVLGLWWLLFGTGLLLWVGGIMSLCGTIFAAAALQRLRFGQGGGGPGVVQLDEGQLTYFGPLSGGSVAARDIATVGIASEHKPPHWLIDDGETTLLVPVNAERAELLFDVFARLPGLDLRALVAARDDPPPARTILWRRSGALPEARRLH